MTLWLGFLPDYYFRLRQLFVSDFPTKSDFDVSLAISRIPYIFNIKLNKIGIVYATVSLYQL